MILDQYGVPFPQKSVYEQFAESVARDYRDNLTTLAANLLRGWTAEQHRHWVQTGEEPV